MRYTICTSINRMMIFRVFEIIVYLLLLDNVFLVEEISFNKDENLRPWFFKGGLRRPKPREKGEKSNIWPEDAPKKDRIVEQLMSIPEDYDEKSSPLKTIVIRAGEEVSSYIRIWAKPGRQSFLGANCPVNRCSISYNRREEAKADAILFKNKLVLPRHKRPLNQIWIISTPESPYHTKQFRYNNLINWTATYRRDSDVVDSYGKWIYYDKDITQLGHLDQNYAANKTHKVAWFVSNCRAKNDRLEYARELQKHISVDIYGKCGSLRCAEIKECYNLLNTKYKFYLAFENSNCLEYITEKLFFNGLQHNVLPIVMGAPPEDYAVVAPFGSYIHVDNFASPRELAKYLHKLDANDDLYNSYFRWKGTGEFIEPNFFCRLCSMLHEPRSTRIHSNLHKWWNNKNVCTRSRPWPMIKKYR